MRFYLTLRDLPPAVRPCAVARRGERVLLAVQPGALRANVMTWCVANLSRDEQNALRAGLGQPRVGQPIDLWLTEGHVTREVPLGLRLVQEQGGVSERRCTSAAVLLPTWGGVVPRARCAGPA